MLYYIGILEEVFSERSNEVRLGREAFIERKVVDLSQGLYCQHRSESHEYLAVLSSTI